MKTVLEKSIKIACLATLLATSMLAAGCATTSGSHWQSKLASEMPVMGHRNWIVIADSAYPAQSRAGIETIATGAGQIEVVNAVLKAVDNAKHVRANVYLDAEMKYVAEESAPGIEAYRRELAVLLNSRPVKSIPHEQLIVKLDEAAKTFRILILKTNLTLPYTSVFLELDCGYWGPQAEQRLRDAIQKAGNRP
ncbi:MAG: RbsD/FucU domain-containing protein [Planctomycetota bacterium]|jgi:L-fucose mutarotase/ribose pyranase (RbsD/FucU family)